VRGSHSGTARNGDNAFDIVCFLVVGIDTAADIQAVQPGPVRDSQCDQHLTHCTRSGRKISVIFYRVSKEDLPCGVALAIATNLGVGLPTEPIGSVPRPAALIAGIQAFEDGRSSQEELEALYDSATRDTIERFEATGSPVITDGEQRKHSFATYSIHGLENVSPDGIPIFSRMGTSETFLD
jgi:hypothetical protein